MNQPYDEIVSILYRASRPDLVSYLCKLRNNPLFTVIPTMNPPAETPHPVYKQLNKAIELLEACSEDLFLGFGADVELENRVDEFIKKAKQL